MKRLSVLGLIGNLNWLFLIFIVGDLARGSQCLTIDSIQSFSLSQDKRFCFVAHLGYATLIDLQTEKILFNLTSNAMGNNSEKLVTYSALSASHRKLIIACRISNKHASSKEVVELWDGNTGALMCDFYADRITQSLSGLSISPNGRRVLFCYSGNYGSLECWDTSNKKLLWKHIFKPLSHSGIVYGTPIVNVWTAQYSPNGRQLMVSTTDGLMCLDPETGNVIKLFDTLFTGVLSIAWSNDGKKIFTGGSNCARLLNMDETGNYLDFKMPEHKDGHLEMFGRLEHADFSPDNSKVVVGSIDNGFCVWDTTIAKPLFYFQKSPCFGASFVNNKDIITVEDGKLELWDGIKGLFLKRIDF